MVRNSEALYCPTQLKNYEPDGSSSCFDMANHKGEVLIITDMTWTAAGNGAGTGYCSLNLGSSPSNNFFISASSQAGDGLASGSEHLTTGLKFTVTPSVDSLCGFLKAYMQGYLMPNN